MFGVRVIALIFAHLLRIIHHHFIVQLANARLRMDIVELPDIEIAQSERLL